MGRTGGGLRNHGSGALDHRPRPEGSRRWATAERPGSPQGWRKATASLSWLFETHSNGRTGHPSVAGSTMRLRSTALWRPYRTPHGHNDGSRLSSTWDNL